MPPQVILRPPLRSASRDASATVTDVKTNRDAVVKALDTLPRGSSLAQETLQPLRDHLMQRMLTTSPTDLPVLLDAALSCLLVPSGPVNPQIDPSRLVAEAAATAAAGFVLYVRNP